MGEVDPNAADPGDVVHPLLFEHFSVLRRTQTERDREDQNWFVPRVIERYGLRPSHVRMIPVSSTTRLWFTPGSKGAGLSKESIPAQGRGSWFAPVESICSRGIWGLSESLDGRRSVCGLVPDGNAVVRLQLRAGGTQTLATVEGAVIVTEIERLTAVGFLDAFGSPQEVSC